MKLVVFLAEGDVFILGSGGRLDGNLHQSDHIMILRFIIDRLAAAGQGIVFAIAGGDIAAHDKGQAGNVIGAAGHGIAAETDKILGQAGISEGLSFEAQGFAVIAIGVIHGIQIEYAKVLTILF